METCNDNKDDKSNGSTNGQTEQAIENQQQQQQDNLMDTLLTWFQGDFDNYHQVVHDRRQNWTPREGGGHEHIHCSLIPVTNTSRLAAFYFDGQPTAIFRFRFYRLQAVTAAAAAVAVAVAANGTTLANGNPATAAAVDTLLYTLDTALELKLRTCADPLQWPTIFAHHVWEQAENSITMLDNATMDNDDDIAPTVDVALVAVRCQCVTLLPNCEVRWSTTLDPVLHAYALTKSLEKDSLESSNDSGTSEHNDNNNNNNGNGNGNGGLHAVMVHGSALLDSQMMPGQKILVYDQLSLWRDALWIHDRGYNPDTMTFIYGNQRGIPYRMQRVTTIQCRRPGGTTHSGDSIENPPAIVTCERTVTDQALAWTLGSMYRSQTEYDAYMQTIGGKSTVTAQRNSAS
jgi:CpeT/CpcT family (DUF1001)